MTSETSTNEGLDDPASTKNEDAAVEDLDPNEVQPQVQTGIVAGLAATLTVGGAIMLAIAKTSDTEILISIQPQASKGDATTALPIQISGTPEEIDANLLDGLAHYVPARQFVNRTVEQIAADTTKAAAAAKKVADAKRAATAPSPKTKIDVQKLLVNATPQFCKLSVLDAGGKKHVVNNNKRVDLPLGTYTITASADGYTNATATVALVKDRPEKVDITLKRDEPSLLDTITGS
jgi:PRTRC genetic system protein E